MCAKSLQSCPTLCDTMDYSLPGSFVHGGSHGESKQQQKRMAKGNSLNRKETIKKKTTWNIRKKETAGLVKIWVKSIDRLLSFINYVSQLMKKY